MPISKTFDSFFTFFFWHKDDWCSSHCSLNGSSLRTEIHKSHGNHVKAFQYSPLSQMPLSISGFHDLFKLDKLLTSFPGFYWAISSRSSPVSMCIWSTWMRIQILSQEFWVRLRLRLQQAPKWDSCLWSLNRKDVSPMWASQVALVVKNPPAGAGNIAGPWFQKIPLRRTWQPTPASLPGKSHGQRSLVGYSP